MTDKRYVVGLQKPGDLQCYVDTYELDTETESRTKADELAAKHQRSTIIYDRKNPGIIYKKEIKKSDTKEQPKKTEKVSKKQPKEQPKLKKDDFFED